MSGKSGSRLPGATRASTGQLEYEPVRRRSRPTRSPVRSSAQTVAPRGLSTRATPIASARAPARAAVGGERPLEQPRRAARRSAAAPIRAVRAGRGHRPRRARRAPARSRRRRAAGSSRARPRPRPRRAPPGRRPPGSASAPSSTPTSISRSWNERVEDQLAPGRSVAERSRVELGRAPRAARRRRSRAAPADATVPNSSRWPASARVEAARLLAERGETLIAGGQAHAGADRRRCR